MTPAADPAKAVESLLAWWRLAGVDAPAPPRPATPPRPAAATAAPVARPRPQAAPADPAGDAVRLAAASATLAELRAALEGFSGCPLKATARTTVFSDGVEGAPVMIVGEAPGRDEDEQGRPFVGRSGQLLDRMFACIGVSRARNLYIANVIPWRPPGNRDPSTAEIAACLPFVRRQIALAQPRLLILMGRISAQTLLGVTDGVLRLRGRWTSWRATPDAAPIRTLPMLHPAYLLRHPAAKALAWADLLAIEAALTELGVEYGR